MNQTGDAIIGVGEGIGENRVSDALEQAIHHPLLEDRSINGAKAVLLKIAGGNKFTMHEFHEIQTIIRDMVSEEAHIIAGFLQDPTKDEQVTITVIATGF